MSHKDESSIEKQERLGKDLKDCFEFEREKKKLLGHVNEPVLNKWMVDESFQCVIHFLIYELIMTHQPLQQQY